MNKAIPIVLLGIAVAFAVDSAVGNGFGGKLLFLDEGTPWTVSAVSGSANREVGKNLLKDLTGFQNSVWASSDPYGDLFFFFTFDYLNQSADALLSVDALTPKVDGYLNQNKTSAFLGEIVVDVWDPESYEGEYDGYTLRVYLNTIILGSNWTNEDAAIYHGSLVANTYLNSPGFLRFFQVAVDDGVSVLTVALFSDPDTDAAADDAITAVVSEDEAWFNNTETASILFGWTFDVTQETLPDKACPTCEQCQTCPDPPTCPTCETCEQCQTCQECQTCPDPPTCPNPPTCPVCPKPYNRVDNQVHVSPY